MNLFHRNFDQERLQAEADRQRQAAPVESFSRAELEAEIAAAHAAGFAEGQAAGDAAARAEAAADSHAQAAAAAGQIAAALATLHDDIQQHRDAIERDLFAFLSRAAELVLPEIERAFGPQRFAAEVRALARRVAGSERVQIRVAASNIDPLRQLLLSAAPDAQAETLARFSLVADQSLDATAVIARWQDGGSEHSFHKICAALQHNLAALSPHLASRQTPAVFHRHHKIASPEHSMTGASHG